MKDEHDEPETQDDPKGKESEEAEEIEAEKDGVVLFVQQESTLIVKKRWLQKNIFRSTSTIHEQHCKVVIDGGSCENIISQTLIDHLKLKIYKHNHPYLTANDR